MLNVMVNIIFFVILIIISSIIVFFLANDNYLKGFSILLVSTLIIGYISYNTTYLQTDGLFHSTERQDEFVELVKEITDEDVVKVVKFKPKKEDYLTTQIKDKQYDVYYTTNQKEIKILQIKSKDTIYYDLDDLDWGIN